MLGPGPASWLATSPTVAGDAATAGRGGVRGRVWPGGPLLDKQGGWEGFESAARAYEQHWEGFESAYLACSEERRAVIECLG